MKTIVYLSQNWMGYQNCYVRVQYTYLNVWRSFINSSLLSIYIREDTFLVNCIMDKY